MNLMGFHTPFLCILHQRSDFGKKLPRLQELVLTEGNLKKKILTYLNIYILLVQKLYLKSSLPEFFYNMLDHRPYFFIKVKSCI
jgi:hypothetical protein